MCQDVNLSAVVCQDANLSAVAFRESCMCAGTLCQSVVLLLQGMHWGFNCFFFLMSFAKLRYVLWRCCTEHPRSRYVSSVVLNSPRSCYMYVSSVVLSSPRSCYVRSVVLSSPRSRYVSSVVLSSPRSRYVSSVVLRCKLATLP